jgi:superfamily I DNA/RNA helicase
MLLLNAEQQLAVESDGNCLVVACPGSGKSRLIVTKATSILRTDQSAKVILVSFTRDSTAELRQRVSTELRGPIPKNCVISTFDSLTLQQMRRSYGQGSSPPRLIMGDEATAYFIRVFKRFENGSFKSFQDAKERLEHERGLIDFVPDEETPQGSLYAQYNELLTINNVIDMAGVHRYVVEGLYMGTIMPYGATHIMVDEFQDVDQSQLEWILCHETAGAKITAVGDDDQSIYGFRSALGVQGMLDFAKRAKAKKIFLKTNYRCHAEIVSYAESMIKRADTRIDKALLSARGPGGSVSITGYESEEDEVHGVVTSIMATMSDSGSTLMKPNQYCILARTNSLLDSFDALLTAENIPIKRAQGKSFWESKPACFLLNFFESLKSGTTFGIDQTLSFALDYSSDVDTLHEIISDLNLLMEGSIKLVLKPFSAKGKRIISSFCKIAPLVLEGARSNTEEGAEDAIVKIFEWLNQHCAKKGDLTILSIAEKALLRMKGSLHERVKRIKSLIRIDESKDSQDEGRVFLCTMHGSKGLEFDNVWLVCINKGVIPDPRVKLDDELRLFYVAITRAKNRLAITYNEEMRTQREVVDPFDGIEVKIDLYGPSPFIEEMQPGSQASREQSIAAALLEAM